MFVAGKGNKIVLVNLLIFIALMSVVICSKFLLNSQSKDKQKNIQYKFKKTNRLLNFSEQKLYGLLIETYTNHHVFSEVALNSVVTPNTYEGSKYWWALFRLIGAKSLDFVICDKEFNVLFAIELDGPDHSKKENQVRDVVKNKILESANLQLIRIPIKALPESKAELVSILSKQ